MRLSAPLAAVTLAVTLGACSGNVFELADGTCFNDPAVESDEISEVPVVDCTEPHDNEVFATFQLPDGEFPGVATMQDSAMDACIERFDDWAGISFIDSALQVYVITPTANSWELKDDREIACVTYREDEATMTGSMAGAGV